MIQEYSGFHKLDLNFKSWNFGRVGSRCKEFGLILEHLLGHHLCLLQICRLLSTFEKMQVLFGCLETCMWVSRVGAGFRETGQDSRMQCGLFPNWI